MHTNVCRAKLDREEMHLPNMYRESLYSTLPHALAGALESRTLERVEFDRVCTRTRLCRLSDAYGERVRKYVRNCQRICVCNYVSTRLWRM